MIIRRRKEYYYNPVDTEEDVAVGIKYPFNSYFGGMPMGDTQITGSMDPASFSSNGLFELSYSTEEQATSNLRLFFLTMKGERMMHPNFGTDLLYRVFEQKTDKLKSDLKSSIVSDLNYWLPYIVIDSITITFDNEHAIEIKLDYKVTDSGSEQTIVIFVEEGGVVIS